VAPWGILGLISPALRRSFHTRGDNRSTVGPEGWARQGCGRKVASEYPAHIWHTTGEQLASAWQVPIQHLSITWPTRGECVKITRRGGPAAKPPQATHEPPRGEGRMQNAERPGKATQSHLQAICLGGDCDLQATHMRPSSHPKAAGEPGENAMNRRLAGALAGRQLTRSEWSKPETSRYSDLTGVICPDKSRSPLPQGRHVVPRGLGT
jgi:hypothetical protein